MKRYVTEFVGTLLFVFAIGMAISPNNPSSAQGFAPLAIGAALMALVYMGGHVSGAHYNPAVSLGAAIRGALPWPNLVPYWLAQIFGGIAGAYAASLAGRNTSAPSPYQGWLGPALAVEFLFTFLLVLVVLNVATSKHCEGRGFYGLAIGGALAAGIIAAGWVSGGAYNPAVTAGLQFINQVSGDGSTIGYLPFYTLAQLAGGVLAALLFRFQDDSPAEPIEVPLEVEGPGA